MIMRLVYGSTVVTPEMFPGEMISECYTAVLARFRVTAFQALDERRETSPVLEKDNTFFAGNPVGDFVFEEN